LRLAIFGASGGIGRAVMAAALSEGHEVTALTRDAARLADMENEHLRVVEGDAREPAVVARVVGGADAVISALGATANRPEEADMAAAAMRSMVDAMLSTDTRRLVALSGAAITMPGEAKPLSGRVAAWVVDRAAHWVVEAKRRESAIIAGSDLDWTLVRPPNVVAGPARGTATLRLSLPAESFRVTQGDVAAALLRCATDRIFVREAPFVG